MPAVNLDQHGPASAAIVPRARRRRILATLLAVVVLLGAAFAVDPLVANWIASTPARPSLERIFGGAADPAATPAIPLVDQWLPLVALLAILFSLPDGGRRCWGLLVPLVLHLPVLHLLKYAVGRARPFLELGAYCFTPFSGGKYASFPSGHTALAAIVAIVLGLNFRRARWILYAWAIAEGIKRIVVRWHFLSDVLAGYMLAAVVVWVCYRLLGPRFYGMEPTQTVSRRPFT